MREIIKKMLKNKTFYVFLFLIAIMFPTGFYAESETQKRAIIVSLALDKNEEKYEISAHMIVPVSGDQVNSNVTIVSGEGKNIGEALSFIGLDIGKRVGLAHCDTLVVSDEILKEDLAKTLDYFVRTNHLTKNAHLINVPTNAKELLEVALETKNITNLMLSDLVDTEGKKIFVTGITIESFYRDYYNKDGVSCINIIELEDNPVSQSSSSSSQSGSSGSGGVSGGGASQSQSKKKIRNKGNIAVLKNGIKIATITDKSKDLFNLFNPQITTGEFVLENVNTSELEDATLTIEFVNKLCFKKYSFKDGSPVVDYYLVLIIKLTELQTTNHNIQLLSSIQTHVSDEVKKEIERYLEDGKNDMLNIAYENNVDVLSLEEYFYKWHPKQWNKFINSLDDQDKYLEKIKINIHYELKDKF